MFKGRFHSIVGVLDRHFHKITFKEVKIYSFNDEMADDWNKFTYDTELGVFQVIMTSESATSIGVPLYNMLQFDKEVKILVIHENERKCKFIILEEFGKLAEDLQFTKPILAEDDCLKTIEFKLKFEAEREIRQCMDRAIPENLSENTDICEFILSKLESNLRAYASYNNISTASNYFVSFEFNKDTDRLMAYGRWTDIKSRCEYLGNYTIVYETDAISGQPRLFLCN